MDKNGLYARDAHDLVFHKADESASGEQCVGVAFDEAGNAYVRDEKDPGRGILAFTPEEWRCFVAGVRRGQESLLGPAGGAAG